jgi:hypothetical protein
MKSLPVKILVSILIAIVPAILWAQEKAVIYGKVTDDLGQPLEMVNVAITGTQTGTATGQDGKYTMAVPAGEAFSLDFSFIGYHPRRFNVNLLPGEKREFNVTLEQNIHELQGVEIKDEQARDYNYVRLDPKGAKLIPTLTGGIEAMLKTLPGVSSTNELSSQYSVRGGNFDENLVYVNGIEIYRPFLIRSGQQEGLSFINTTLVSGIVFSAGGPRCHLPEARFHGRLAASQPAGSRSQL